MAPSSSCQREGSAWNSYNGSGSGVRHDGQVGSQARELKLKTSFGLLHNSSRLIYHNRDVTKFKSHAVSRVGYRSAAAVAVRAAFPRHPAKKRSGELQRALISNLTIDRQSSLAPSFTGRLTAEAKPSIMQITTVKQVYCRPSRAVRGARCARPILTPSSSTS